MRSVEPDRFRLSNARFQAEGKSLGIGDGEQFAQYRLAVSAPSSLVRHEHALQFGTSTVLTHQRPARHGLAILYDAEKRHRRVRQCGYVRHVVALRRVERGHVGVALSQHGGDPRLVR